MSTSAALQPSYAAVPVAPGVVALQRALLWSVGAGGAIVFIEPSPYELATLGAMIVFFATGLRIRLVFVPLLLLLFCLNIGYTISASYMLDQKPIINWIFTSWYMAVTVIFFAMVFSEDTAARLDYLKRGLVIGGIVASLAAIIGYFGLLPGAREKFTLYSRASGTFKDPNVLAAFLILPALFTLQNLVTESFGKAIRSGIALGVMALAVLLAFSRAAWGQMVVTAGLMLLLMFMSSGSKSQRSRIVIMSVVAVAVAVLAVLALLSMDSVSGLFKQRANFEQNYDSGRFGRFGRYVLGAQMALEYPLGIGPLQFTKYVPEDTHNSYLNAFMSGGWMSGVTYPALILISVVLGFRYVFVRVPWQKTYLAIFAAFLGTVGESFIIDTDHWRHFWLMLGAMWGMFVAAETWLNSQPQRIEPPPQSV